MITAAGMAAAGTLLGGAGTVLGALKGSGGDHWKFQKKLAKNPFKYLMSDAKKYGIHPLAALGHQSSFPAAQTVGQKPDLHKMGQGIEQMFKSMDPITKEFRKISLEKERAELKKLQMENVGQAQQILNMRTAPIPSPLENSLGIIGQSSPLAQMGGPAVIQIPSERVVSKQLGVEAGIGAVDSHFINQHGSIYNILAEKAAEGMESDSFSHRQRSIGKTIDYFAGIHAFKLPNHPRSQKTINFLKRSRPILKSKGVPISGYEARYNPWRGLWVVRAKKGGKSYLFDRENKDQYRMKRSPSPYKLKKSH